MHPPRFTPHMREPPSNPSPSARLRSPNPSTTLSTRVLPPREMLPGPWMMWGSLLSSRRGDEAAASPSLTRERYRFVPSTNRGGLPPDSLSLQETSPAHVQNRRFRILLVLIRHRKYFCPHFTLLRPRSDGQVAGAHDASLTLTARIPDSVAVSSNRIRSRKIFSLCSGLWSESEPRPRLT
ncbi:hypothetical protein H6P81_020658 [Aristolochia fimbriata]|uniref:Uncharacterized protein n=1 Tax=Aristolochia fimbriata TaxID=158543 RepID=A0AAV7DZA6_ARIFI|nr:hypothetical protein H6P81_020658 [Aristolochia fimbriata]